MVGRNGGGRTETMGSGSTIHCDVKQCACGRMHRRGLQPRIGGQGGGVHDFVDGASPSQCMAYLTNGHSPSTVCNNPKYLQTRYQLPNRDSDDETGLGIKKYGLKGQDFKGRGRA